MKNAGSKISLRVALVALVAGIGMFLVWYGTQWGAGLISDSFHYVASARSLVAGKGFSIPYGDGQLEPMTKYPPMFSVVLALFEMIGISALQGARVINILLFGLNIFLIFASLQHLTRSYYFSLLGSFLFSISFVLIEVHSWALSESLYICLGLSTFLALERYFEESKLTWLVASALLAACAVLTRYVGISLIAAAIIVILFRNLSIRQKLRDALLFGSGAVLPAAIWTLRNYMLTSTFNDRMIQFHPLTKKNYASAINVVYEWFLPPPLVEGKQELLLLLSGLLLVGAAVYLVRASKGQWLALANRLIFQREFVTLHLVYAFMYGVTIIVAKTWVDADIGMSDRMLSPMLVSLLILLATSLAALWNRVEKAKIVIGLVSLGLIVYYLAETVVGVQRFHQGGIGIARRGWNRSEVVQSLRNYSSFSIYTNSNSSLYLWSDRAGYNIRDFELLKEKGTDEEVLLVIFRNVPPSGDRLQRLIDSLNLIQQDQIVSIYTFGSE